MSFISSRRPATRPGMCPQLGGYRAGHAAGLALATAVRAAGPRWPIALDFGDRLELDPELGQGLARAVQQRPPIARLGRDPRQNGFDTSPAPLPAHYLTH